MTHTFEVIEINETIKALFTNDRLERDEVSEGYHVYHIRGSDDGSELATIEASVMVNHTGTIVVQESIDLGADGFIEIDSYNFTGEHTDI